MRSEETYNPDEQGANAVTTCLNCRAAMPREMRFCRACGQRLGEGLAEYVETVRFENSPRAAASAAAAHADASRFPPPIETKPPRSAQSFGERITDDAFRGALRGAEELFENLEEAFKHKRIKLRRETNRWPFFGCGSGNSNALNFKEQKRESKNFGKSGARWPTWISLWIVIALSFSVFGLLMSSRSHHRNNDGRTSEARAARQQAGAAVREQAARLRQAALETRARIIAATNGTGSMIGVSDFKSSGNKDASSSGALIEAIAMPGSPADKAGLIGGDIVTSFDDQIVKNESDIRRLLAATPAGKSVEVSFIRDGETKRTSLVTATKAEIKQLESDWDETSDKRGALGLDDSDFTLVSVLGTNLYGVRLDDVEEDSAAAISGLREKDVIVEFDRVPIRTAEEFAARIERAAPESTVKAVVMRGAQRLEIPIRIANQDD